MDQPRGRGDAGGEGGGARMSEWDWMRKAADYMTGLGHRVTRDSLRIGLHDVGAPFQCPTHFCEREQVSWRATRAWLRGETDVQPWEATPQGEDEADGGSAWNEMRNRHLSRLDAEDMSREVSHHLGDKAVGILCMGDTHIGATDTDYPALEQAIEYLQRDNVYCLQVGDLLQMDLHDFLKFELAAQQPIPEQLKGASHFLKQISEKCVGLCSGNHDERVLKRTGIDVIDYVMANAGCHVPYHPTQLTINMSVGDHSYRFCVRHSVLGNSATNPAHGCVRWMQQCNDGDVDAVIAGHKHQSANMRVKVTGRWRWAVQLGAFPHGSLGTYALTKGFADKDYSPMSLAVLEPKRRRVTFFDDVDLGLLALEGLNRCG